MIRCRADLHIHTGLSPCAGDDMTPPVIVARALDTGLNIIAITDHNSSGNTAAVIAAAAGTGLIVLPGMEVQTREDVHLVCLFGAIESALDWQEVIKRHLPVVENREDYFGPQILLDGKGLEIGRERIMLLNSTDLSVDEVVSEITRRGGICIASHVDRPAFSLLESLGFIPPGLNITALELGLLDPGEAVKKFPQIKGSILITASDAHYPPDIGRRAIEIELAGPDLKSLETALKQNKFTFLIR